MRGLEAAQQLVQRVQHLLGELLGDLVLELAAVLEQRGEALRRAAVRAGAARRAAAAARSQIGRPAVWTMSRDPEVEPARALAARRGDQPQRAAVEQQAGWHAGLAQQPLHPAVRRWPRAAAPLGDSSKSSPGRARARGAARATRHPAARARGRRGRAAASRRSRAATTSSSGGIGRPVDARVALRREAPAEHVAREALEVGDHRLWLAARVRAARSSTHAESSRWPSASRRSRIAPRAHERRRGDDEAGRLHEAEPFEVREDLGIDARHGISSCPARGRRARPARRAARGPRRSRRCAPARCSRSRSNCSSRRSQERMFVSELAALLVVEAERQLLELAPCGARARSRTRSRWRSSVSRRSRRLALAALAQLLARRRPRAPRRARSSCGSSSATSRARGLEQPLAIALGRLVRRASAERVVEQLEAARLGVPRVGLRAARRARSGSIQRAATGTSSSCSRSAPLPVQRQPAEQDHARDRVGDLRQAGAREVVVDEPLRAEAREQPLRDPLLEVQVNGRLGEHARVLEHDRPDRRLAPPVGELLAACAGARSVSSVAAQLGSLAARRRAAGTATLGVPRSSAVSRSGSAPSSSSEQ